MSTQQKNLKKLEALTLTWDVFVNAAIKELERQSPDIFVGRVINSIHFTGKIEPILPQAVAVLFESKT